MLPLVTRRRPDNEGKDHRHDRTQCKSVPADDLLIAADDLELRRDEQRGGAMRSTTQRLTQQAMKKAPMKTAAISILVSIKRRQTAVKWTERYQR